ncbi:unnamed protein product, partial [Chrysoparadoxa australica]
MSTINQTIIRAKDGREYYLQFELEDAALMDGRVPIVVEAIALHPYGAEGSPRIKGTATLDLERGENGVITVELEGHEIIEIPVPSVRFDDDDFDFTNYEDRSEPLFDFLADNSLAHQAGRLAEAFPVGGEPLACVLKAGITTSIGQLIQCNYDVRRNAKEDWKKFSKRRKGWRMLKCLGINSFSMLSKSSLR